MDVLDRESVVMINAMIEESNFGTLPINPQVRHPKSARETQLRLEQTDLLVKKHAGRCSLNNMTTITFGMRTDCIHHPLVAQALKLSREFM